MQGIKRYLHESTLRRPGLEHVGDGDGGIPVGKVGVVPSSRHRDAEPVPGNPRQRHMVELPYYPLSTL